MTVTEYRSQTCKLPETLAGDGEPQPNLTLGQAFIDQASWADRVMIIRMTGESGSEMTSLSPIPLPSCLSPEPINTNPSFPRCLMLAVSFNPTALKVE